MNAQPLAATDSPSHVEAYCCTGSSPGRTGRVLASFDATFGGRTTASVGYEIHGPTHAAPVVVLGGISAGRHIAPTALSTEPGWWPGVVEPLRALDPHRYRLIGVDYVGGPDSRAELGHPISTQDQARVLAAVLDQLDIQRVTLVGSSYGGMVSLAFATLFPGRVEQVVALCAAHRTQRWRPRCVRFSGIRCASPTNSVARTRDSCWLAPSPWPPIEARSSSMLVSPSLPTS